MGYTLRAREGRRDTRAPVSAVSDRVGRCGRGIQDCGAQHADSDHRDADDDQSDDAVADDAEPDNPSAHVRHHQFAARVTVMTISCSTGTREQPPVRNRSRARKHVGCCGQAWSADSELTLSAMCAVFIVYHAFNCRR